MLALIMGGLALLLIGAIAVTDATASTVLMILGGCVSLGGMAGGPSPT